MNFTYNFNKLFKKDTAFNLTGRRKHRAFITKRTNFPPFKALNIPKLLQFQSLQP